MMNRRSMPPHRGAITATIAQALTQTRNLSASSDLLFLEAWEHKTSPDLADMLRAAQIRRANPILAAALRAEIQHSQTTHPRLAELAAK